MEHLTLARIKLENIFITLKYKKFSAYEIYLLSLDLGTLENVSKYLGCSANTLSSNILKNIPEFPRRVRTSLKNKFIEYIDLKLCTKCKAILNKNAFHNSTSQRDNKHPWCINCSAVHYLQNKDSHREQGKKWRASNPHKTKAIRARARAKRAERIPKWADFTKIEEIYKNCPSGMQVDHIVPLIGENVSGLHVHYNLQYLTPEDNRRKSNKYS